MTDVVAKFHQIVELELQNVQQNIDINHFPYKSHDLFELDFECRLKTRSQTGLQQKCFFSGVKGMALSENCHVTCC